MIVMRRITISLQARMANISPLPLAKLLVSNKSINMAASHMTNSIQLRHNSSATMSMTNYRELCALSWDGIVSMGSTPLCVPRCGDVTIVKYCKGAVEKEKPLIIGNPLMTSPTPSLTLSACEESNVIEEEWCINNKLRYLMIRANQFAEKGFHALFRYHMCSHTTSIQAIAKTCQYLAEIDNANETALRSTIDDSNNNNNSNKKKEVEFWRVELLQKQLVRWIMDYFVLHSDNVRTISVQSLEYTWPQLLLFSIEKRSMLVQDAIERYGCNTLRFYNDSIIRIFTSLSYPSSSLLLTPYTFSFLLAPLQWQEERLIKANNLCLNTVFNLCGSEIYELLNAINKLTERFKNGYLTSSRAIATAYSLCCQLLLPLHLQSTKLNKHFKILNYIRQHMYALANILYEWSSKHDDNNRDINEEKNTKSLLNILQSTFHLHRDSHSEESKEVIRQNTLSTVKTLQRNIQYDIETMICTWWLREWHEWISLQTNPEQQRIYDQLETLQEVRKREYAELNERKTLKQIHESSNNGSIERNNFNDILFTEPSIFFASSQLPESTTHVGKCVMCVDCSSLKMRSVHVSEVKFAAPHTEETNKINTEILAVLTASINKFVPPDSWVNVKETVNTLDTKLELFVGKRKHKVNNSQSEDESNSDSVSDDNEFSKVYSRRKKTFARSRESRHVYKQSKHL